MFEVNMCYQKIPITSPSYRTWLGRKVGKGSYMVDIITLIGSGISGHVYGFP